MKINVIIFTTAIFSLPISAMANSPNSTGMQANTAQNFQQQNQSALKLAYWRQCETKSDCGSEQKCCHQKESDGNGTRCRSTKDTRKCEEPKPN